MAQKITVDKNGFIIAVEPASSVSFGPAIKKSPPKRTAKAKPGDIAGSLKQSRESLKRRSIVSTTKSLVQCRFCNSKVREDNLVKHTTRVHRDQKLHAELALRTQPAKTPSRNTARATSQTRRLPAEDLSPTELLSRKTLVRCSICQQNLRADSWDKHVKKVHAKRTDAKAPDVASNKKGAGTPQTASSSKTRKGRGASIDPDVRRKALRGLNEETNYADKYLGHFRREADGRFGSIPLYDDYSEESGA